MPPPTCYDPDHLKGNDIVNNLNLPDYNLESAPCCKPGHLIFLDCSFDVVSKTLDTLVKRNDKIMQKSIQS